MNCKKCKGTGTIYLEGSIHGEDICPKCLGWGIVPDNSILRFLWKQWLKFCQ